MLWRDVLDQWDKGEGPVYPKNYNTAKNRDTGFLWNTSVIKSNGESVYKEKYKLCKELPQEQNFSPFKKHMYTSTNKYAVSFPNLSMDALLVVPMPRHRKNFSTLRDFIDNASPCHQRRFWKEVSKVVQVMMAAGMNVWVSTHGLGVPYLHVRVSYTPKYYFSERLAMS